MNQRGFSSIILIVTAIIISLSMLGAGFYLGSLKKEPDKTVINSETNTSSQKNATSEAKAVASPNVDLNEAIKDNRWVYIENGKIVFPCHISITLPAGWRVLYNPSCIDLAGPDYKLVDNPRPGVLQERIGINFTIGHAFFPRKVSQYVDGQMKEYEVNDIQSYVESKNEDFNEISDIQDKTYGRIKGIFYSNRPVSGSGQSRHVSDFPISNFVFANGTTFYHATWQQRYEKGNEVDLNTILYSIEFVKY